MIHTGTPLDCLALWPRDCVFLSFTELLTIIKTLLGRSPPPGHCTHSRLRHSPDLPVRKACLLNLKLHSEGQALGFPYIWKLMRHFQGMKAGRHHPCTHFWPHYNLARIPRKEFYTHKGPQFMQLSPRECLHIWSGAQQKLQLQTHKTIYIYIL